MEALFTTITFEKPPGVGTPNGFRYTPEGSSLSQNLLYHLREQLASDFSRAVIFIHFFKEDNTIATAKYT